MVVLLLKVGFKYIIYTYRVENMLHLNIGPKSTIKGNLWNERPGR